MVDTAIQASNEARIRNLEKEVERLRAQLESAQRSTQQRTPIGKLVQTPVGGGLGRDQGSNQSVPVLCDVVWINSQNTLYVTQAPKIKVYNWSTTKVAEDGSRLALAVKHDDGKWYFHGFDCNDDRSTPVVTSSPNEVTPGGGVNP